MTLDDALLEVIAEQPTITSTLAAAADGAPSVFASPTLPDYATDSYLPALNWRTANSVDAAPTHNGASGLRSEQIQFVVTAKTEDEAKAVRRALVAGLHAHKFTVADCTLVCFVAGAGDTFQASGDENNFISTIPFKILHNGDVS